MDGKIIATSILTGWVQFAHQQGIATGSVLQHLGLQRNDTMVPFEKFGIFAAWLMQKTGNDQIGIRLGEQASLAALGIVGQLIQSSRTIQEAITQACTFFELISNVIQLNCSSAGKKVSLVFVVDSECYHRFPKVCRQVLISTMAFAYKEIHFLTLQQYRPLEMQWGFPITDSEPLATLFNCPISHKSNKNQLIFDSAILEKKINYSDYELMLHIEKLACNRLAARQYEDTLSDRVKTIVYKLMEVGFPKIQTIALQLNMSERSLQRRLKKENTSYSLLLTAIKKSVAIEYLSKNLSVKETTYLLGYSEPSAFISAFVGWFGKSPQQYKREESARLQASPSSKK